MNKQWQIGLGIVGVLVAVLLLGGLATGAFARASTLFSDPAITTEQAKAAVLEANPGATVVAVELERGNSKLVYEVGLDNGLELLVDANTGALLGPDQDEAGDQDDVHEGYEGEDNDADEVKDDGDDANESDQADKVAPAHTGISASDARTIALKAYPDATVLEIEFDREGGVDLFEAELDDGTDVKIDAATGAIIGTEVRDTD
jgi:uncharacterized membrane protein YkoI